MICATGRKRIGRRGEQSMARTVGIGYQDFAQLIINEIFYVDKTAFIKEWWENKDMVTLITRPRRFGKTLNLSMLEQFFSVEYAGRGDLFEGLAICLKGQTLIQNKPSISKGYFSTSLEKALFCGLSWISSLSMIFADF